MIEFVVKYWIQELFALILAALAWIVKKIRQKKTENDILKEGIIALLHDRLYTGCSFFIDRGWCSINDRENLEYLYRPYKALGGNGTGESLYRQCLELPLTEDRQKA
jgi:hypothetical protein